LSSFRVRTKCREARPPETAGKVNKAIKPAGAAQSPTVFRLHQQFGQNPRLKGSARAYISRRIQVGQRKIKSSVVGRAGNFRSTSRWKKQQKKGELVSRSDVVDVERIDLHNASDNRQMKPALIRFRGDGTGKGVCWEEVTKEKEPG